MTPMQARMQCRILQFEKIAKRQNKVKAARTIKRTPPQIVRSDFVVQAYRVKAAVIPRVMRVAIKTLSGLLRAQRKATQYPMQKVKIPNKI